MNLHNCSRIMSSCWSVLLEWRTCSSSLATILTTDLEGNAHLSYPSNQPAGRAAKQPASQSAEQPGKQPASQPSSQTNSQPVSRAARQTASQSAEQPDKQPASQLSSQTNSQTNSQLSSQTNSQPNSQPSSRTNSQPNSQPSSQTNSQPNSQPSSQPNTQLSSQPNTQLAIQPAGKNLNQTASEPFNHLTSLFSSSEQSTNQLPSSSTLTTSPLATFATNCPKLSTAAEVFAKFPKLHSLHMAPTLSVKLARYAFLMIISWMHARQWDAVSMLLYQQTGLMI